MITTRRFSVEMEMVRWIALLAIALSLVAALAATVGGGETSVVLSQRSMHKGSCSAVRRRSKGAHRHTHGHTHGQREREREREKERDTHKPTHQRRWRR